MKVRRGSDSYHYHFDALPFHPQPKALEATTGYLARLADMNGIQSLDALSAICFPNQNRRTTRQLADYPPLSFDALPHVAVCSESTLLATTFFYLGRKLGRSTHPQALSRFMSGSVAQSLRYCPHCLAESACYLLPWRFLILDGCPEHRCRLLDQCEHCGEQIPLFAAPFKVGCCPSCQANLDACPSEELGGRELALARSRYDDLVFLLSPEQLQGDRGNAAEAVGQLFAHWRHVRQRSIADVVAHTGLPRRTVYAIEKGEIQHIGAKFKDYVAYADYLQITLREILTTELPQELPDQDRRAPRNYAYLYEDEWARQAIKAERKLAARGKPVTQKSIAEMVGMSVSGLMKYPQVRVILEQVADRHYRGGPRLSRQDELVRSVLRAVSELESRGELVTQQGIGDLVGITPAGLKHYPLIKDILQQATAPGRRSNARRAHRERELLDQVYNAIVELESLKKPITQVAIGEFVGMSPSGLKKYSQIREILTQVAQRHH